MISTNIFIVIIYFVEIHTAVEKLWFFLMYEQYIPFDIHKPYKRYVGVFIQYCIVQMGKQDRTNPSNYDYPDKYQVNCSERNQNFVLERIIGDMGHICKVTLGILERLKTVIAHLTTTVVLNCQIVFQPGSAGFGLHPPT